MRTVAVASGKTACGLLWTARFAEHDAVSTMPYAMTATALSTHMLDKALTAIVRPIWSKGWMDKHVACMAATGTPTSLKGLGITHPAALDLAEKACALLRLLNTPSPAGIAALAADGWRALLRGSPRSQAYPKTTKHTLIPATHTGGRTALLRAPAGAAAWTMIENYKTFASIPMGDLCPGLAQALSSPAAASTKSVRAFLATSAGEALTIAKPRRMERVPHY
jgi:hypothetical protein